MQQQQPNTVPPIGNADGKAEGAGSQLGYFIKMMMFQAFQSKIANQKTFSEKKKLIIYVVMFVLYFYYQNYSFIQERPKTLYDIMDLSRLADFDEIKARKNEILQGLRNIDNETFEGNKTQIQEKYNITKEQLKDAYNVLTNHHLREVYDKYNIWYNYDDFVKQKGKNIPTFEKYGQTLKGVVALAPFLMIIYMSFTDDQPTGKTMAIVGFCLSIYIILQIKLPNASANQQSDMLVFINEHFNHKYVMKVLGKNTDKWTVHQFANYFRAVIWQVYFQFTQSLSRLIDKTPDQIILKSIDQISNKHTKTLHIFEIMRPARGMEKLESELSDALKAILQKRKDEAEGICVLDEQGIKLVSGKGKIISQARPQCKKFDNMRYLEAPPYRKTLMSSSFVCDGVDCKKVIETKKGFYNCMKCRYDLCLDCSGHNKSITDQEKQISEEEEAAKTQAITADGEAPSDVKPGPFADQIKEILADGATESGDKNGPGEEEAKKSEDVLSDKISSEEAESKDFDSTPRKEKKTIDEIKKIEQKETLETIPEAEISMVEEDKLEKADEKQEDQDKQPENSEVADFSTEVAKVQGSEEKKADETPKPFEIIRTAANKYQFIGDILPVSENDKKLMKALTEGLPETFENELFEWPEEVDPKLREIFDKLKIKEERLIELAKTLAKKDTDLVARAQEAVPPKRITMSDLRGEEWKRHIQSFQTTPQSPLQKENIMKNSSWGKYVLGSFSYVMELRKAGLMSSMKKQFEKEKEVEKASWSKTRKCVKYSFFLWLSLVIITMIAPFGAFELVKYQIRGGNWGDFTVNPPPFDADGDEIEDFNDAFIDIEKEFDDEDKDDVEETPQDATDAKNSTVSEEPKTESEESVQKEATETETKTTTDASDEGKKEEHVNEDL